MPLLCFPTMLGRNIDFVMSVRASVHVCVRACVRKTCFFCIIFSSCIHYFGVKSWDKFDFGVSTSISKMAARSKIVDNWTVSTLAATIFFISYSHLAYMIWGQELGQLWFWGFYPNFQDGCPAQNYPQLDHLHSSSYNIFLYHILLLHTWFWGQELGQVRFRGFYLNFKDGHWVQNYRQLDL